MSKKVYNLRNKSDRLGLTSQMEQNIVNPEEADNELQASNLHTSTQHYTTQDTTNNVETTDNDDILFSDVSGDEFLGFDIETNATNMATSFRLDVDSTAVPTTEQRQSSDIITSQSAPDFTPTAVSLDEPTSRTGQQTATLDAPTQINELNSIGVTMNGAGSHPHTQTSTATDADLFARLAQLINTQSDKLDTRFDKLDTRFTKLDARFDEVKTEIKLTNDKLEHFKDQFQAKINILESTQIKQSEELIKIRVELTQNLDRQMLNIREECVKEIKEQYETVKGTVFNNNMRLENKVDKKLNDQAIICQSNLIQQKEELSQQIETNKQQLLNQILPMNKQIEKIGPLNDMISAHDQRLNKMEDRLNKQEINNVPNIYVTCTGNGNTVIDNNCPKFHGRSQNPKEFLNRIRRFYERNAASRKMEDSVEYLWDLIEQSLESHAAKWFELVKDSIKCWNDFEQLFIARYWSREVQRGIKQRIEVEKYRPNGKLSRAEYFVERVLILRSITPPLSEEEIVTTLAEHFSELLQDARRVQNINTVSEFELLLQREDLKDAHQRSRYSNPPRSELHPNRPVNQNGYQRPPNSPPRQPYRNNNNFQQRPQHQAGYQNNNHNFRRDYGQRQETRDYHRGPNGNNSNNYQRKEERQYPSKEQARVCTTIVERSSSQNDSSNASGDSMNLNR
uniref:Retrotransposon gag domain-containing protein n=1 Tax=Cuerna arida TaxID=1464854 RepID=A0A1B6FER3_9HEMI